MPRFFKMSYPSKKTLHPDGNKTVVFYAEGPHKKGATEKTDAMLEKQEPDSFNWFKLPKVTEVSHADFLEWQDQFITNPPAEETPENLTPLFNEDSAEGITDDVLRLNVARVCLFGFADAYQEQHESESLEFAQCPASGTPEEQSEFGEVYETVSHFMPRLYKTIEQTQLRHLINFVVCELKADKSAETVKHQGANFITSILGLEWQTDIEDQEPPAITDDEPDINIFKPEVLQPVKICTFDKDLLKLNAQIDNLLVGESITIDDLSNELYHASNSISKSTLDLIERDPSLLEWQKKAPFDTEKATTLNFGTAFHTLVLEPHKFDDEFLLMPELNLRTNDGKAEKVRLTEAAAADKKQILTFEEKRHLDLMAGSVRAHPMAKKLLSNGRAEVSIFYRYSKTLVLRIRPDWLTELNGLHFIMDLKSTPDVAKFEKSVAEYRYHVQDAFYSFVFEEATGKQPIFCFCATGKAIECGRYPTRLSILEESDKAAGYNDVMANIQTIEECNRTGVWGGFETITRPSWATRNDKF